uniref:Putative transcription elongation regulator 1 isoform x1 rhagoletis zephyria n=1 Tax=Lutzomyia longipalpis TaxID=7200 RepID=A0A1B0CG15_LUTLO
MEVDTPKESTKMDTDEQPDQQNVEQEGEEEFNRFQQGGRGGFRGRPWGPPPRFGGRGYGPPGGMMRGRGQPPFYRGRGGGPPPRFQGPNYDWNPMGQPPYMNGPPGMNPHMPYGGPQGMQAPPVMQELWVETKTEEGKSYYYHAVSRETTWTRPEGPHIKIMTQAEVEALNAKNPAQQQTQQMQQQAQQTPQQTPQQAVQQTPQNQAVVEVQPAAEGVTPQSDTPGSAADPSAVATVTESAQNGAISGEIKTDPVVAQTPQQAVVAQAAPVQAAPAAQQPQPLMQSFMSAPPPQYNQQAPFAMPPPGFHGFPPAQWGVPPNMPWAMHQEQQDKKISDIDPTIVAKAAEWTEHKAPDGRPYYYNAAKGESVWERPQALRDLDAARIAAQTNSLHHPPLMQQPLIPPAQHQVPPPSMVQQVPGIQGSVVFDPLGFAVKPQGEGVVQQQQKKDDESEEEKSRSGKEEEGGRGKGKIWTGDGRVFFYNPSTRTSVWERPEDLLERADVDKAVSTPPEQLASSVSSGADSVAAAKEETKQNAAESPKKRSESDSSDESDETPTKKVKIDDDVTIVGTKSSDRNRGDIGKEAAMEAEVRASRERALVPLDIRVKSFKEMLKEKDVSAFSTWEKELHKIVFDPRYLLLTSRERKQVFEKYVKERAEEERREKRNKMRQKREDFRALMESANLHGKSSFTDFVQRFAKDDRFKAIEKVREREGLFNEFIVDLRKREKEDKIFKKEQVRKEFIEMLKDNPEIDRHCRWVDVKKRIETDARYRAVESGVLREDYFHEYCRIMKEEKKRAKEKEKEKDREKEREKKEKKGKRDKSKDREKEKEKEKKRRDSRKDSSDRGRESSVDQEEGEHPPTSDEETDRQQKERERQIRAEASIKEREKEVQRTLATHLRDRDKEREHHKRDEAIRHFTALLADLVRNADLTWKEVKKQLRKDHRWELVEQLEREDRERIFNDHIGSLAKKKRDKFREMLDEMVQLELTSSWKEVKRLIKEDPRYLKYNSSEKCEREFREYVRDKTVEAKSSFRELLQECKLITHKSFDTLKDNPNHLREIEEILKNDKRYLVLEHIAHERTQMILHHLEDLNKRGPPPPPTASESTRRK